MNKRIYLIALICIFLSCKQPKKNNADSLQVNIEYKSNAKGTFFLILNKIVLPEPGFASFVIKQPLNSNKSYITKNFQGPLMSRLPDYIQIRLSTYLEGLEIKKITFKYKKNNLIIFGKDIERYFTFTPNIIFDSKNNVLKTKDIKSKSPAIIRLDPNYIRFLERK